MVTINIYGLDQYAVSYYSKTHTDNLASLCETTADNINFVATENSIFHNGIEQNSWNILVHVHLPKELKLAEKAIAKYLLKTIGELTINVHVEFYYYERSSRYSKTNDKYPLYITDINLVKKEVSDEELFENGVPQEEAYEDELEDEECDNEFCVHHHVHNDEDEDEENPEEIDDIFLGNAFDDI